MEIEIAAIDKTSPLSLLKDPSLLKTDALINGQWLKGASRFDVLDPATGQKLADVANLTAADAQTAIAAANAAWPAWKAKTAKERSTILRKGFDCSCVGNVVRVSRSPIASFSTSQPCEATPIAVPTVPRNSPSSCAKSSSAGSRLRRRLRPRSVKSR